MTKVEPIKFTFDRAFDGGAQSRRDAELEQLRASAQTEAQTAWQQGADQARQETLQSIEAARLETLQRVEQAAATLFNERAQLELRLTQEMVKLSHTIASTLAPKLMNHFPIAEMEELIQSCLSGLTDEKRLLIRVHPDNVSLLQDQIDLLKKRSAFEGDIILIDEPGFHLHDIRIEWPNGGAERLVGHIQEAVDEAIQRFLLGSDAYSPDTSAPDTQDQR